VATMVPVSAAAALRMMRSQNQDRVLWIIAICINQKDLAERAQQVQMMSLIYSRSTGNLIYLGEGDGSMRSALKSLQNVYHDLEQETDDFTQLDGTLFKTGTDPVREETKLTCGVDIPALKTLFSLPWFRSVSIRTFGPHIDVGKIFVGVYGSSKKSSSLPATHVISVHSISPSYYSCERQCGYSETRRSTTS